MDGAGGTEQFETMIIGAVRRACQWGTAWPGEIGGS